VGDTQRDDQERGQALQRVGRQILRLEVRENDYSLLPADSREVDERQSAMDSSAATWWTPRADLNYDRLHGSQASAVAVMQSALARSLRISVSNSREIAGLAVPRLRNSVSFNQDFVRRNNLGGRIATARRGGSLRSDPRYRKVRLARFGIGLRKAVTTRVFVKPCLMKLTASTLALGCSAKLDQCEDLRASAALDSTQPCPTFETDEQLMEAIRPCGPRLELRSI